jgi:DNA-binding XRE family transcriptional regulator
MSSDETSSRSQPAAGPGALGGGESEARRRLKNNVRRLREDRLLTKAELARKAGVSTLTIDRVESGLPCRMDTKRKIILALGMAVADKDQVFVQGDEDGGDTKE